MDDVLKIAVGVFIGALAAAFTWEGIQTVRVEIALRQANAEIKRATQQAEANNRARQAAQQAASDRQAREQQAREQQAQQAAQLQQLRRQDKEDAWKRFFRPSESCVRDAVQGDCANAYMKAKTVFESQYQPTR